MPYPISLEAVPAATRTSSGVGVAFDLAPVAAPPAAPQPPRTTAVLTLRVDTLGGVDPTLAVEVQTSEDMLDWTTLGAFTPRTTVGSETKRFPGASRYLRAVWTVGGTTPSITFKVAGEAVYVLATPKDLDDYGIRPEALKNVPLERKDKKLCAVSGRALRILGRSRALPILEWSEDLRDVVARIASIELQLNKGTGAEDAKELNIQLKRANDDLESIGNETTDPQGMMKDATPDTYDAGAFVSSAPRRGW